MLNHFGLFSGICWPFFELGHFSVVEFWSCCLLFWTWAFECCWVLVCSSRFQKKHRKYQAKRNFWVALLMFLMLALSQAHVEKKSSHVGLLLRPFQPMLGQCGATLVYVGTVLGHVVSYIGPMLCWAYVDACCTNMEPCCPMLGRCWLMWGRKRCVEPFWAMCWPLSCFGVVKFWVHARRL